MKQFNLLMKMFILFRFLIATALFAQEIQWEQLSGPHGGAIYSIVTDNAGTLYASAMWNNGPYKSTDNGETWVSIKNGMTPGSQYCPMNISQNGDLFVAGFNSYDNCIYRSTDGGTNWTISLNTAGWSIFCISFDQDSNIYAGTYSGIYKSTDNGDNWTPYGTFTGRAVAIAVNDSGHVFVGDYGGGYRTTDDGASWEQLPVTAGTTIAINNYGHLFVGCSGNGGILRSTDNGDSWTYVYPVYTIQIQEASTVFIDANDDIYFPTYDGKGVIKSTDNGDTWIELSEGLGYKYLRAVAENMNGFMFTGGDYALYKSNSSGTNWFSVGVPVCSVKKIAINSNDDIFAGVWGVNRSLDRGQTWETINNGLSGFDVKAFAIKQDGTFFLGCGISDWAYPNPCIFRSSDNGNSWTVIENGIQRHDVEAIAVDTSGNVYAGNYYGVYKSTNNGDSWENIGGVGGAKALAFNSTGDLFLASYGGGFWKLPAGSTNWIDLTSNIGSNYIYTLFLGSNDYIYTDQKRSTDNGQTWTNYSVGEFVYSVAENSAGHLFFGTNSYGQGIYRSIDYGDTWELINIGFPSPVVDINALAVDSDDYLYAGTTGKSIFKTTTSTVVSVDEVEPLPSSFKLEQNYPNPFKASTVIHWQTPMGCHQTLKIYNIFGEEMATLVDEYKPAGKSEFEFNAAQESVSAIAPGVYFYQLKAGSLIQTKKMILIKK